MMIPDFSLEAEQLERIRSRAAFGDKNGYLSPELVDWIVAGDWLRMLVPARFGGAELPLPEVVARFEALARADGSLGWCVNLGAGANMFAGYLEEKAGQAIFDSPRTWCAGSGAITGRATETADGYVLNGYWKYASGAAHATHFTGNAYLYRPDGSPLLEDGKPLFRSFIVPAEHVHVLDTWKVSGLRASSSRDFEIREVFVPREHTFSLIKPSVFATGPLYRFPFELLAVVNMSSMSLGMGQHFIEEFNLLAEKKAPMYGDRKLKDYPKVLRILQEDVPAFYELRATFYEKLNACWKYYETGTEASEAVLSELKFSSLRAAAAVHRLIPTLAPFCGMSLVYEDQALNLIWRDISVGSAHFIFSPLRDFA